MTCTGAYIKPEHPEDTEHEERHKITEHNQSGASEEHKTVKKTRITVTHIGGFMATSFRFL